MVDKTLSLPYPVSANRYWRNMRGRMIRSDEANAYRRLVEFEAARRKTEKLNGDVFVGIVFHPKTTKRGIANRVRLDLDNCIKVCLDALNGIAYLDDSQVVKITAEIGAPVAGGGLSVSVTEQAGWVDA